MRVFIDTNLWAYRLDQRDPAKAERIRRWLEEVSADHEVVISTQVLIELRSVATRKLRPALDDASITAMLDALIAEAAIRSRCSVLFSEDFNHGGRIGSLELVNPLLEG
jgi:predicted nucleic acid-binding protein